ncbi:MAG: iron complex outermembrane receptor protein [Polaribacter sp.]|jgi:iron complex outermembrane receptor protein
MFKKTKLSYAVAMALTVGVSGTASAALEEIVVTATKRAESAQDIPITVQALGEQSLEDLGIANFKDYIRNLAGVTSGGRGPGRNEVFIRGVSVGKGGLKIAGAVGSEPTVSFFLDEAPISIGGRNIDPYMTDMSRVEVLPGPQGTLFGASSQAGTVRLITNKPVFNEFQAGFDLSIASTKGGEVSNSAEGYINIPLVEDKLAARFALYNAKEGGYIDNVRSTKQISLNNPTLQAYAAFGIVPERAVVNNNSLAQDNFNDATYTGIRSSLSYAVNDNWDVLVQHLHQEIDTEGVWDFDPALGDFNSQSFTPDYGDDDFDHTSWTVNGRIGTLELVYTGSFLDRSVEAISDYSGYADSGPFIPYYICDYPSYASCGQPDLFLDQTFEVERTTHEIRIATDADNRLRGILGIFNDDTETVERGDWNYQASIAQGFAPNAPIPGATSSNPNARPAGVTFFNDYTRGKKETSVFGELAYDISDSVTATIGARRYDLDLSLRGSSNFGNRGVDRASGRNVDEILKDSSPANFTDTIFRGNLQWNVNDNVMLYTTLSEGYRPGGFNRNGGASLVPNVAPFIPDFFESDELTNFEIGWKTSLFDDTLRFNGAVYKIDWEGMQVITLDFNISNLAFINNTADSEIKGIEFDSAWQATDNFTLFTNFSYNDTELTRVPANIVSIAPEGSALALAPEVQVVVRGRYEWDMRGGNAFTQAAYAYTDDTVSSINVGALEPLDSYSTVDLAAGYAKDNWSATLFVENATDELAEIFISNEDDILKTTPNRPRTVGLRFSYKF